MLADHDRPLRRRGHETEIATAKHITSEYPGQISDARTEHAELTDRLGDLDRRLTEAETLNNERPDMNIRLDDIDQRLLDDRRNRSRSVARDQPGHVVETLGARPETAKTRQAWDIAAGTLDQHHTAYTDNKTAGPPTMGNDHSNALLSKAIGVLRHTVNQEQQIANQREGPALSRGR